MSEPAVGFYGDDVTGSVDALLQFTRRGWRGRLFTSLPSPSALADAADDGDVVGSAGIARSLGPAALEAEVRPALGALAALRPAVLQYKACSTVDSSPEVGSLGRVLEIGRDLTGARPVPLLFAQPDFGRYTVFGHHFAADNGVVYRLDRQPPMSRHPSTPMSESDIARHLGAQTALALTGIPLTSYTDAADLARRIEACVADAVVLDALDAHHLRLIGEAIGGRAPTAFVVGSGGLSAAIADAAPRRPAPAAVAAATGPVLVVSGSRSPRTRRQTAVAADAGWFVAPLPRDDREAAPARDALRAGRSVVLASDLGPDDDGALDGLTRRAARIVRTAVAAGETRRVIVCGGDSSSRVVRLLGIRALSIAANPWGNVALLHAHADGPLDGAELLLKGGQVGDDDLFERVRTGGAP